MNETFFVAQLDIRFPIRWERGRKGELIGRVPYFDDLVILERRSDKAEKLVTSGALQLEGAAKVTIHSDGHQLRQVTLEDTKTVPDDLLTGRVITSPATFSVEGVTIWYAARRGSRLGRRFLVVQRQPIDNPGDV